MSKKEVKVFSVNKKLAIPLLIGLVIGAIISLWFF